jgi:hypothetical protein
VNGKRDRRRPRIGLRALLALLGMAAACTGCGEMAEPVTLGLEPLEQPVSWDDIDAELRNPANSAVDLRGGDWPVHLIFEGGPLAGTEEYTYAFNDRTLRNGTVSSISMREVDSPYLNNISAWTVTVTDCREVDISFSDIHCLFFENTTDGDLTACLYHDAIELCDAGGYTLSLAETSIAHGGIAREDTGE